MPNLSSTPLLPPQRSRPSSPQRSQIAIAIGRCLQRSISQVGLAAVSLAAGGYGGFKMVSAGTPDPVDGGLLGLGALILGLTYVVRHGPYDLVTQLERAVHSMESTSTELRGSTEHLRSQVADLRRENDALESTREKMHTELEQSELVRRGMQQTLNTLLTDVGERNGELQELTAAVALEVEQLGKTSEESANRFLKAITGVDEQMQRADQLSRQLTTVSRSNTELSRRMVIVTHRLEEALNELQDAQFAETMQSLLLKLDALGDNGLRERLQCREKLLPEESTALAALLAELDQQLRDTLTEKAARCDKIATVSRKVVDESLGSVFID